MSSKDSLEKLKELLVEVGLKTTQASMGLVDAKYLLEKAINYHKSLASKIQSACTKHEAANGEIQDWLNRLIKLRRAVINYLRKEELYRKRLDEHHKKLDQANREDDPTPEEEAERVRKYLNAEIMATTQLSMANLFDPAEQNRLERLLDDSKLIPMVEAVLQTNHQVSVEKEPPSPRMSR